jgi:hypothetical protein
MEKAMIRWCLSTTAHCSLDLNNAISGKTTYTVLPVDLSNFGVHSKHGFDSGDDETLEGREMRDTISKKNFFANKI